MAWSIVGVSTNTEVASGNITVTEPTGAASGDLLVACIAYRSNAAFALPSGWALVATQQSSGDTDITQGIASGLMAYIVRGGSAPSYLFTRTAGDVAQGYVIAYRGSHATPYDTGTANTLAVIGAPSTGTFNTAGADELIVAMVSHGDNSLTSAFDAATDPATASGATDTTTAPTAGTWIERADRGSNTGADTGLGIADAVRSTAGATGTISATAVTTTRSVMIAGAFKPPADVTVALTGNSLAAAVGTLGLALSLLFSGIASAGSIGTVVPDAQVAIIGEALTGSVGTLTPSIDEGVTVAITGVQGTGGVGTPAPTSDIPLTSSLSTAAIGAVSLNTDISVTGLSATGVVDTLTASIAYEAALTGIASTGNIGTLAPNAETALTGLGATVSQGTLLPSLDIPVAGILTTSTVDLVIPNSQAPLTGLVGTGAVGNLGFTEEGSVGLIGEAGIGAVGTVVPSVTVVLSGVSAIGTVGTVEFTPPNLNRLYLDLTSGHLIWRLSG